MSPSAAAHPQRADEREGLEDLLAALSFESTVPRGLVHKRAVEEVLLTDSLSAGGDRFLCAAQLPRAHRLYGAGAASHHDLVVIAELVRQAAILIGHEHLGVPADRQFLIRELRLGVEDADALRVADRPAEVVIEALATDRRELEGELASYSLDGTLRIDGRHAVHASGACVCLAPEDYRAIRGAPPEPGAPSDEREAAPQPADPASVGRWHPRDVVISAIYTADPQRVLAQVMVDESHPSFFDHPLDHVPGMLLLEAARQTAVAALAGSLGVPASSLVATRFAARFEQFAELGSALTCTAAVPPQLVRGRAAISVAVEQSSRTVFQADVELSDERGA